MYFIYIFSFWEINFFRTPWKKKKLEAKTYGFEGEHNEDLSVIVLLNIERSFATRMFPPTAAVNEITHKNRWQSKALTLNNLISAKFKEKICK